MAGGMLGHRAAAPPVFPPSPLTSLLRRRFIDGEARAGHVLERRLERACVEEEGAAMAGGMLGHRAAPPALFQDPQRPSRARFFFSSRRRHTRLTCDWSSDVCSSD